MKMKICVLIFLMIAGLVVAQDVKPDSTVTKSDLLKKYKMIADQMKQAKTTLLVQLAKESVKYNSYDAVENTMRKLIEELNDKKVSEDKNKSR